MSLKKNIFDFISFHGTIYILEKYIDNTVAFNLINICNKINEIRNSGELNGF